MESGGPTDIGPFATEIFEQNFHELQARAPGIAALSEADRVAVITAISKAGWQGILRGIALLVYERLHESHVRPGQLRHARPPQPLRLAALRAVQGQGFRDTPASRQLRGAVTPTRTTARSGRLPWRDPDGPDVAFASQALPPARLECHARDRPPRDLLSIPDEPRVVARAIGPPRAAREPAAVLPNSV